MLMKKLIPSIVLLIILSGLPLGCSKRPRDSAIAKNIETKAATAVETRDSDIQVVAQHGRVKITGVVKNSAAQQKREEIAREEPGTTAVDDQTTIASRRAGSADDVAERLKSQPIVVPEGTSLTVRIGEVLGSKKSKTGDIFIATLAQDLNIDGRTAIRRGAEIDGKVLNAKAKGRFKGQGELSLTLTSIVVNAKPYSIQTEPLDSTVKGKGKRTAATTGGGAAGGALIGGIAGGGKGAGIGAVIGGSAGFLGGIITGNNQIEIPMETVLSFQLSSPLTLPKSGE